MSAMYLLLATLIGPSASLLRDIRSSMPSRSRRRRLALSRYMLRIIVISFIFAISAHLAITIKCNYDNENDLENQIETKIMKEIMKSNSRPLALGNYSEFQEKPISNISQKTKLSLKQVDVDKSANNITRFITFGSPRTASTLQFNMVCVCFFLNMKVHFPSLANTTNCYSQRKGNYSYPSLALDQPQVMKSHDFKHITNTNKLGAESVVFITARTKKGGYKLANNFKKLGNIVGLTQDLETLSEIKADGFLDLYAHFFDLPSHYLPMLQEHYTIWEKLRVCCGVQMSKHWRYELNPATSRNKLEPHPYCGSLDIDVVEKAFMNTTIFKMIDDYSSLGRILRPALKDEALYGRYCSSYNEAVRTKGLKFNQQLNIV